MNKKWLFIVLGVILFIVLAGVGFFCVYQFTDVFGGKVIPKKIDSITIRYAPGYNIATAEALNAKEKYIEFQEVSLTGDEFKNMKTQLSKIREKKEKSTQETDQLEMVDNYEVLVNKKIKLLVGDKYGMVVDGKKKTTVVLSNSFTTQLQKIVDKNNKKVIKTIPTENVFIKMEGASIQIKSKSNLKLIQDALSYYPVNINADYKNYDDGYHVEVILDNNVILYLYKDSALGYLSMKEGENDLSTFVVLQDNLYDLIQQIYETSTK